MRLPFAGFRNPIPIGTVLILAGVYFAVAKLGLRLAFFHPSATPVWPPTGIALASLLIVGYHASPGIFLGAFLANLTTFGTVWTSLGIATGNTLEGLVGAYLVNKYANGSNLFDHPRDIFKFAVLAAVVSTTVSATIGVTSLALGGFAHWADYQLIWLTWWLGDAAGALVFAPLLILFAKNPRLGWGRRTMLERAFFLIALLAVSWTVFGGMFPFVYLTVPFLVWAAFRFDQRETAAVVVLLTIVAVWGTVNRLGPFAGATPNQSLLMLQAFMGIMAIVALPLASVVAERKAADQKSQGLQLQLQRQNALLEERVRERTKELADTGDKILHQLQTITALYTTAQKLSQSLDLGQLSHYVVETSVKAFGARFAWIGHAEQEGTIRLLAHWPSKDEYLQGLKPRWDESPAGGGLSGRAIRSGFPVVAHDIASESALVRRETLLDLGFNGAGAFPLVSRDKPFGVLMLYSDQAEFFSPARLEFFQAFANLSAAALETARLFEETEGRLQRLQALRNIDMAITSTLDLRVTLNVILDQIATHLHADAANVLLFDPHTQTLRHATNRGFRTNALRRTDLRLGEGHAGRAALERRIVSVPDLLAEPAEFSRSVRLPEEGFVAYYAVPLFAKGQIKGVVEILHRSPLSPTPEWMSFLEALAGQAAIAIDNSTLFDSLQRANVDLVMAYDTTLESLTRALELRDKETEGHTRRVTDLTLRLARTFGMKDEELVPIRHGALLHDIGKIGIPDRVLLKPGPLTDDEWKIMQQHPVYARDLLSSIPYLRSALDIPYCHHEKWDGSGYPRGLRGDDIPLAARIFAVADVWDALRSDRPYRPAWTEVRALAHIREQAGKHFDPKVVELFLAEVSPAQHEVNVSHGH